MASKKKGRRADREAAPAAPQESPEPPVAPLISLGTLGRWLLPGMAVLLCVASWIRFGSSLAENRPPMRLLALDGEEPWNEREVLRVRCGFTGQFVAVGDRVWTICAPSAKRWELLRWDFPRGVMERRWKPTASKAEVVVHSGLPMGPVVAAALQSPLGDLALVVHGQRARTPVELVLAHPGGGLEHHPLPELRPGTLVGFTYQDRRFLLLTNDCRQHVLEPGKPAASAPLSGCPYDPSTVLEWARYGPAGWRLIYSRPARVAGRRDLFLLEPGPARPRARELGSLRSTTKTSRGEALDLSPGNVLPVRMARWPSHRLHGQRLARLEQPPKTALDGIPEASLAGTHVVRVGTKGLQRLHLWLALSTRAGSPAARPRQHTIQRWRWAIHLPTRWIAGEVETGAKRLALTATAPDLRTSIAFPRTPSQQLNVLPAKGGGYWLFDSFGFHLRVNDELRRTDAPGIWDRFLRIWRSHHMQRSSLHGPVERPLRLDEIRGWAHRIALPVVLLTWPLLLLLVLPLARRYGKGLDPRRPLRASLRPPSRHWIVAGALYLGAAAVLLWSFWQVTAAF